MAGSNHSKVILLSVVIVSLLFSSVVAAPNDWFTFKGNYFRTSYTTLYVQPDLKTAWKFNCNSPVTASPVVSGNYVFVSTEEGYVFCCDIANGERNWTFPNSSLADYKDEDGEKPWPNGEIGFQKSRLTVPVTVFGRNVYIPYGQMLFAVNADSGRVKWRGDLSIPGHSGTINTSPLYLEQYQVVVVGSSNGWLYGFDKDGRPPTIRWRIPDPSGTGDIIESSPAFSGSNVYYGSNSRSLFCAELKVPLATSGARPQDKPEGKWSVKLDGAVAASPAISGSRIIVTTKNGKVYAVSTSGGNILWTYDVGGSIEGSPAVGAGNVVFISKKTVCCLSESDGKWKWDTALSNYSVSTPAIGGNYVYITSTDGKLYVFSLSTGGLVSAKNIKSAIKSSPVIAQNKVFFGADDGFLYTVENGQEPPVLDTNPKKLSLPMVLTKTKTQVKIYVENTGGGVLEVIISSSRPQVTLDPESFKLKAGQIQEVVITIDTNTLLPGNYLTMVKIISNGGSAFVPIDPLYVASRPDTVIFLWVGKNTANVNGNQKTMDAPPWKSKNGSVMVPLRFVAESFDCRVDWDQATKKVTVNYVRRGIIVTLFIGKTLAYIQYPSGEKTPIYMKDSPQIVRGRTFVPIEFMAQAFDARWSTSFDSANNTTKVKITIKGW